VALSAAKGEGATRVLFSTHFLTSVGRPERGKRPMLTGAARREYPGTVEPDHADSVLIRFLGQFCLLGRGRPLDLSTAGRAVTLLATLALRLRSDVPHEELLAPLWPEQDATQSTESLNSLNSAVHRRLRNGAGEGTAVRSSYLNTAAGYSTDSALSDARIAGDSLLASAATEGGRCCSG
jgi:hypothetical protein